jgi:xylulose-5-phosphate/fructose-6-phosphate phosphoketolase
MTVVNDLDRFHLAQDVIDRTPKLNQIGAYVKQAIRNKLIEHKQYITTYGEDMPEVTDWQWGYYSLGAESIDGSQQTSTDSPSTKGGEGAANSRE